jgi:hypothetical protein
VQIAKSKKQDGPGKCTDCNVDAAMLDEHEAEDRGRKCMSGKKRKPVQRVASRE